MAHTVGQLSAGLEIDESTLRGWLALAETTRNLGRRDGARNRIFNRADSFALGVLAALHHCGVRVSPSIVSDVLTATIDSAGRPIRHTTGAKLLVRQSEGAEIAVDLDVVGNTLSYKLAEVAA